MLSANVKRKSMRSACSKLKLIALCSCDLQMRPCPTTNSVVGEAAPDLPVAKPRFAWQRMVNGRQLTILFWIYVAQAVAGSMVGFAAPFLYYFGVL